MDYSFLEFSTHAIQRMFERKIVVNAVIQVVRKGEVISRYEEDLPYPSVLLCGSYEGLPLHVVAATNTESGVVRIITVYIPSPDLWEDGYRMRKTP